MQDGKQIVSLRVGLFTNQPILLESWKLLMKNCCGVRVEIASTQTNDLVFSETTLDCLVTTFQDYQCITTDLPVSLFRFHCPRLGCLSCPEAIAPPPGWRVSSLSDDASLSELFDACGILAHGKTMITALSPRELSVVMAYTKGQNLKEIAGEFQISTTAVQSYRNRAMEKLGVTNLVDLVTLAAAYGLRDCPCRAQNEIEYQV
ncbi:MAG: helix-turn-helix transcriptional regulator [Kiritimatiellae bacterium]|jgi:DNA-binding CsgD family transcriptional regulator|nr:helix-turn-helix transcriptional regulator [Kiritimatiellia bacterium]